MLKKITQHIATSNENFIKNGSHLIWMIQLVACMCKSKTTFKRSAAKPLDRKSSCNSTQDWNVQPWAQFGGGHEGRVPFTFADGGDIMCWVHPHFFL